MKITIFDLDDTLVQTDALISVKNKMTAITGQLTAKQFNILGGRDDHKFEYDFSEFRDPEKLLNGTIFQKTLQTLRDVYDRQTIGCITAREDTNLIANFFNWLGFPLQRDLIYCLNEEPRKFHGPVPKMKAWATSKLIDRGFREITLYDDCDFNLAACKDLCDIRETKFNGILVNETWK